MRLPSKNTPIVVVPPPMSITVTPSAISFDQTDSPAA
jgi:hypothetical protein